MVRRTRTRAARLARPTVMVSGSIPPSWPSSAHVFSKKLPDPPSTPMRSGTWPTMIVSASPMMKPLRTGSEMNAARKPRRSRPATIATIPVARASATVSVTGSPSLPATLATMPAESAAVADIGATTSWRDVPARA